MGERRGDSAVLRPALVSALVAALVAGSATLLISVSPEASALAGPEVGAEERQVAGRAHKILLVGDSITEGAVGDYSWRYFAWNHLRSVGADIDFVGPRRKPHAEPGSPWKAEYADPRFDQDHAGIWGDRISYMPLHDRVGLMTTYRPDTVVIELGANDLGWTGIAPEQVLFGARDWVAAARWVEPDIDVVLVEVPWPGNPRAAVYNSLLGGLAAELDDPEARVVVARAAAGYRTGGGGRGDTYDGLHPNTRGQVKIAAAVTDALAALGLGSRYPRPLLFPAEGPRVRPIVKARSSETSAKWRWGVPPGATSFDVWIRRPQKSWRRVRRADPATSYRLRRLAPCVPHQLKVRARKGWTLADEDVTSRTVTVRVGPKVRRAPGLRGIDARRRGVRVSWGSVRGACAYEVRTVHAGARGKKVVNRVRVARSKRGSVVRGLPRGTRVAVQVRALGARNSTGWSAKRVVRLPR